MIQLVLTTFADEESAARVVGSLVSEKLAACGTLLPGARSLYIWKDKLEDTAEVFVIFKIAASRHEPFCRRLAEIHPYEVPEMITVSPDSWNDAYGQWVLTSARA
ncbi:MAG: divalent-cation tolerance protein CutA [Terrimicrobiaceae bacterium]